VVVMYAHYLINECETFNKAFGGGPQVPHYIYWQDIDNADREN
jgi:hypothetical protein